VERKGGEGTNPTISCARLAASGSSFLAMFPLPPRPVVYTSPLSVGVSRVTGSLSEGVELMFPFYNSLSAIKFFGLILLRFWDGIGLR